MSDDGKKTTKTMTVIDNQNYFMQKVSELAQKESYKLDPYALKCGYNGLAFIDSLARQNGKTIYDFDHNEIFVIVQQITAFKVNIYGKPAECYIITRNRGKNLDFDVYGNGNDKLLREFGVGLHQDKDKRIAKKFVVYQGDEFTDIEYVGLDIVNPPKYRRTYKTNKVDKVVYALRLADDTIEWIVVDREQAKPMLIAQGKNNFKGNKEVNEWLESIFDLPIDEIFEKHINKQFEKSYYDSEKKQNIKTMAYVFNDTWRSKANREAMLETKLSNLITKNWDKEFDNNYVNEAYNKFVEKEFHDADEEIVIDHIENSDEIINEETGAIKTDARNEDIIEPNIEDEETGDEKIDLSKYIDDEIIPSENEVPEETKEKTNEEPNDDDLFATLGIKI